MLYSQAFTTGNGITFTPQAGNPPPLPVLPVGFGTPVQRSMTARRPVKYGIATSVQLFVGLAVDGHDAWTASQVRDAIMAFRDEQFQRLERRWKYKEHAGRALWGSGASVIPQLGYWQASRADKAYPEQSVSVVILNTSGENLDEFMSNMFEIARWCVSAFYQDSVIMQLLEGNVVKNVYSFDADTPAGYKEAAKKWADQKRTQGKLDLEDPPMFDPVPLV